MHKIARVIVVVALAVGPALLPAPARALFLETWVSSNGFDGNTCERTSPCKTFDRAHAQTAPSGVIGCIDAGSFGFVTITKSVTIDCTGTFAVITNNICTAGPCNAITVAAGATDVVTLRGLALITQHALPSDNGIFFTSGAALHVIDCVIRDYVDSGNPTGMGIYFSPSGAAKLYVSNSHINENGTSGSSAGIFIKPTGSGSARAVIERTVLTNNNLGIVVDGTGSTGRSVVEVDDSIVAGSAGNGITVNNAGMVINRTEVQGNSGNGILAGPNALIHIGASVVVANSVGGFAYNGGQILSYGDNKTKGNGVDNAPSGVLTMN